MLKVTYDLFSFSYSERSDVRQVDMTAKALQMKYKFGEIIDRCSTQLDWIGQQSSFYFVFAQHGALLFSVLQRVNLVFRGKYLFSIDFIFELIDELFVEPSPEQVRTFVETTIFRDVEQKGLLSSSLV